MTETEFRKLLNKLDGYFIPRQIGSSGKEWITAGSLLGETSIADINESLLKSQLAVILVNWGMIFGFMYPTMIT